MNICALFISIFAYYYLIKIWLTNELATKLTGVRIFILYFLTSVFDISANVLIITLLICMNIFEHQIEFIDHLVCFILSICTCAHCTLALNKKETREKTEKNHDELKTE